MATETLSLSQPFGNRSAVLCTLARQKAVKAIKRQLQARGIRLRVRGAAWVVRSSNLVLPCRGPQAPFRRPSLPLPVSLPMFFPSAFRLPPTVRSVVRRASAQRPVQAGFGGYVFAANCFRPAEASTVRGFLEHFALNEFRPDEISILQDAFDDAWRRVEQCKAPLSLRAR